MTDIKELIAQIPDDNLREKIQVAVDKILDQKDFGLVFESSVEFFPRTDLPVKKSSLIIFPPKTLSATYFIRKKFFVARLKNVFPQQIAIL